MLDFAVSAAFQGLSNSESKNLAKEAPVPHHADLRPKKLIVFIKKYFKREGISFNLSMDWLQLILAARILFLDPICPIAANGFRSFRTVVELVRQAILLLGNGSSFCGFSDRRKSLLAKGFSGTLNLLDETNLSELKSCSAKKIKKAMLKAANSCFASCSIS